ncbi:MAG: hypothetical protein QNJ37_13195 [Crocosphaera sp.]|nr:hypothetical protein [Crocosphaera sp.]
MKKIEMEQLLMRTESISILTERAEYLKNKYGENGTTGGVDAEKVAMIKQLSYDLPQTLEEIKANDHDVVARSELMPDLTQFIADYRETEPLALLRTLSQKHRDNPSLSEQLLIENLINKITSIGPINREEEKVVAEAIEILMSAGQPIKEDMAASKNLDTETKEG